MEHLAKFGIRNPEFGIDSEFAIRNSNYFGVQDSGSV